MVQFFTLMLTLALSIPGFAQDSENKDRSSDKLQLDKLEQKYWAPKDNEFKVVQNRTYSKEGRFSVSGLYGLLADDAFTEGSLMGATGNYYFTEYWGLELSHLVADSEAVSGLKRIERLGSLPDFSILNSSTTLSAIWVPFYAKMSVMDNTITYFDMALGLGVGQTAYTIQTLDRADVEKTAIHLSFDVTQHFYINKHFALRFDLKYQPYKQERLRQELDSGETEKDRELPSMNYQNLMLLLGATYFF